MGGHQLRGRGEQVVGEDEMELCRVQHGELRAQPLPVHLEGKGRGGRSTSYVPVHKSD